MSLDRLRWYRSGVAAVVDNQPLYSRAFLRISLELHRDRIPWRARSGDPGGREAPRKLNAFLFLRVQRKLQICPIIDVCKIQKITQWMNESLFNDASPTNLHVVTSPISTYSCPWIQTSLTCAPAQVVVFHLLHTDLMQLYTVSEKIHPWRLTVSCCNLSAILSINPLNTVRLSTQSSTIIRIVVIVELISRRIRILVVSASYRRFSKNSLKVRLFLSPCPFPYSSRFLIHVCSCMYSCQLK